MNYKERNLFNKIYVSFIKGEYGPPKIPTKSEVVSKMEDITSSDYVPITDPVKMDNIDIKEIQTNFTNIIDDIDILFDSIESESVDVLDQLTHSLKEHNGTKRELKKIGTRTNDIKNGKLGTDYLEYKFTENFDDIDNINTQRSDPINTDAGVFTIRRDADNVLTLDHYRSTKLEFNVVENYARIIENGYVGNTDASAMLDQDDPRQLVYKITTNQPSRLRVAFSLQLLPDGRPSEINAVTFDLDSQVSKGAIRLYYKDNYSWVDVKNGSIKDIKNDKVQFTFPNIKTTHIKVEFIKNYPDVPDSNTYQYPINNIAISRGSSRKKAILYSKPINFDTFSDEVPIVSTIEASGSLIMPPNCEAKLYVALDTVISGGFLDSASGLVDPKSPNIYSFDPNYSGSVYLSDIWSAEDTVSGVSPYKGVDFNWVPIQVKGEYGEKIPQVVNFDNTIGHYKINNSLFTITSYLLFGDNDYSGIYTASGWCNTDNARWAELEPYVDSGLFVSGVDVAAAVGVSWYDIEQLGGILHPDISGSPLYSGQWLGYGSGEGYPFNYVNPNTDTTIKFGDYDEAIDGWWRPYSDIVYPTGLAPGVSTDNQLDDQYVTSLPDMYFNNIPFYKIYKFNYNNEVIDNTIKLFTYQERPLVGDKNYFPVNFLWTYKSSWIDEIGTRSDIVDVNHIAGADWTNYILPISGNLRTNEEYVIDSISEIKIKGTSSVLDTVEYKDQLLSDDAGSLSGISLANLNDTRKNLDPSNVSFNYKYQYRIRNNYLSTWIGYAIVSPGAANNTTGKVSTVDVTTVNVNDKRGIPIIKSITVENLQTGKISLVEPDSNLFVINFDLSPDLIGDQNFKITIYCASDVDTGFCANNWVPYESSIDSENNITVGPYIKLVPKITPISMVDVSTLIYDTPINNNSRAAVIKSSNGEKYVVVKTPSKDIFPGYYFDSLNKKYILDDGARIKNIGHWIRQGGVLESGITGYTEVGPFFYTTGSSGNATGGAVYTKDRVTIDESWNQGYTVPDYPNYTGIPYYPEHSTYGHPINIDSQPLHTYNLYTDSYDPRELPINSKVGGAGWRSVASAADIASLDGSNSVIEVTDTNRGFLYYPTGENLSTFYSISYRKIPAIKDINSRFMYKLELISNEEGSMAPRVDSLQFNINRSV